MTLQVRPPVSLSSVSALFDGTRLTLARQLAGLKKVQLAKLVEMAPASVTSWESGQKKPNSATVARLCMALQVEPQFFMPIAGPDAASTVPHFRSLRSTTQLSQEQANAYGRLVGDVVELVERSVEFPSPNLPEFPLSATDHSTSGPEQAARLAREYFNLAVGPVNHLVRLAERSGVIVVFSAPQTASIDAYSMESAGRPLIILNPEKRDYYRQRFDVAHELGHLIMHVDSEPGGKIAEDQANRFAAEFLMPSEQIKSSLPVTTTNKGWERLAQLKEHWGVSIQALLFRSRSLGVMSDVTHRNAMIRLSQWGWRRAEPGNVIALEMPSLLPAAIQALKDANITSVDIARGPGLPLPLFEIITSRTPASPESRPLDHDTTTTQAQSLLSIVEKSQKSVRDTSPVGS